MPCAFRDSPVSSYALLKLIICREERFKNQIDYLLTECEVCTGKYLPEVFMQTERQRSVVCAKKGKKLRQIYSHIDQIKEANCDGHNSFQAGALPLTNKIV